MLPATRQRRLDRLKHRYLAVPLARVIGAVDRGEVDAVERLCEGLAEGLAEFVEIVHRNKYRPREEAST